LRGLRRRASVTWWVPRRFTGADAIVDSELRVRGLHGLRIADAFVIPSIPSGPTNAPSFMIGGRAAALIQGRQTMKG
jgi:choline dehydrogenase-like flavoprotein